MAQVADAFSTSGTVTTTTIYHNNTDGSTTTGSLMGLNNTTEKIGFYGTTPIIQQGVTASGVTAAQLLTALANLGLVRSL